jgi:hypothetical protein
MGLLSRAKRLDNRVLGQSDTPRGFFANLVLLGLNPVLTPVWIVVALVCIGAGAWAMAHDKVLEGLTPLLVGLVAGARAYSSSRLPRLPSSKPPR